MTPEKFFTIIKAIMIKFECKAVVSTFFFFLCAFLTSAFADNIPAKGTVTMIDLGAKACIPCKMMAPIMEKMEKQYAGKAVIHFYDVWKNNEPARRFNIRVIPTQIFFDKEAKEVYRHEGFMSESDIVAQLTKMGVK
jgi:thioredoxin 1